MNPILHDILLVFEIILLVYFAYVALYTFVLAVAGIFYRTPLNIYQDSEARSFAVFIPAYKEDVVILKVAEQAAKQDYPRDKFRVIVIADSLQPATIDKLKTFDIDVFVVSFETSTKVKALNKALAHYAGKFEQAAILDADNLMEPGFLKILSGLHHKGFKAIQGRRKAKNKNNNLSYLDGLSEEINNSLNGKGNNVLNMSASLKGSGMSFDYHVLKDQLAQMESVGGFDRELELRLVGMGIKVQYADNVAVLDEKVEQQKVFENQRKRWISSQYFYLRKYFVSGCVALLKGRVTYFNSAVLRNIQLPRLLNMGLQTVITALAIILQWNYVSVWIALFAIHMISIVFTLPREYYSWQFVKALLSLPFIFFKMFLLLFRLKGANKKFIHTPHGTR